MRTPFNIRHSLIDPYRYYIKSINRYSSVRTYTITLVTIIIPIVFIVCIVRLYLYSTLDLNVNNTENNATFTQLHTAITTKPTDLVNGVESELRSTIEQLQRKISQLNQQLTDIQTQSQQSAPTERTAVTNTISIFDPTQPSTVWAPEIHTACTPQLHTEAAPCLAEQYNKLDVLTKINVAQEWELPDFSARLPGYINQLARDEWTNKYSNDIKRGYVRDGYAHYVGQYAQTLVYYNAVYRGTPTPDQWSAGFCMSSTVSHTTFTVQLNENILNPIQSLCIVASPDSWSYQHFLDRVTHIVIQARQFITSATKYITGQHSSTNIVNEIWGHLLTDNDNDNKVLFDTNVLHSGEYSSPLYTNELIFSCRAVLVHPYYSMKLAELLNIDRHIPIQQRKTVLYMSRRTGGTNNGGRIVMNEDALIDALKQTLVQRGQNETLQVFNPAQYPTLNDLTQYISQNVGAIIGSHGGALYNQRWAGRDTLIIEFLPIDRYAVMFYEEAVVLEQNYYVGLYKSLDPQHNMEVDVAEVVDVVKRELGQTSKDILKRTYNWNVG